MVSVFLSNLGIIQQKRKEFGEQYRSHMLTERANNELGEQYKPPVLTEVGVVVRGQGCPEASAFFLAPGTPGPSQIIYERRRNLRKTRKP